MVDNFAINVVVVALIFVVAAVDDVAVVVVAAVVVAVAATLNEPLLCGCLVLFLKHIALTKFLTRQFQFCILCL